MPYVEMFRAAEEIAYISDVRVEGDAHVRLTGNEWAWCPVAELIRIGLLPPTAPEGIEKLSSLSGIAAVLRGPTPEGVEGRPVEAGERGA